DLLAEHGERALLARATLLQRERELFTRTLERLGLEPRAPLFDPRPLEMQARIVEQVLPAVDVDLLDGGSAAHELEPHATALEATLEPGALAVIGGVVVGAPLSP